MDDDDYYYGHGGDDNCSQWEKIDLDFQATLLTSGAEGRFQSGGPNLSRSNPWRQWGRFGDKLATLVRLFAIH